MCLIQFRSVQLKMVSVRLKMPTRVQELCERRGGCSWAVRPNEPSGFRGCKAILNHASASVSACP